MHQICLFLRWLSRPLVVLVFLVPGTSDARPVSYPGGVTLMLRSNSHYHSSHLHYTVSRFTSVGMRNEYRRREEYHFHAVQWNELLKRWNQRDSQANIYLMHMAGMAISNAEEFDREIRPMLSSGIATDWENRRFFVGYRSRYLWADSIDGALHQRARLGVAPYIGDYGDLHTWLMLQAEHHPEGAEEFTLTPVLRLFKGPALLEFGIDLEGEALVNFIYRY